MIARSLDNKLLTYDGRAYIEIPKWLKTENAVVISSRRASGDDERLEKIIRKLGNMASLGERAWSSIAPAEAGELHRHLGVLDAEIATLKSMISA